MAEAIKIHDLRPAPGAHKAKTRVGRGEGSKGKTAGRGTKGSKARNNIRAGFEGGQLPFHMRAPKLRGFKNPFRVEYATVNVGALEVFENGATVTVEELKNAGLVKKTLAGVKILGNGDLTKKLTVEAAKFTETAKNKIEALGGKAEVK